MIHAHYENEVDTPIYRIYHDFYMVLIEEEWVRNQASIEARGIGKYASYGHKTQAVISMAKMADVIGKGGVFHLLNPDKDAHIIYDTILELFHHIEAVMNNPHGGNIPSMEDRQELAALMEMVYPVVQDNKSPEQLSEYERYIRMMNFGAQLDEKEEATIEKKLEERQMPMHQKTRVMRIETLINDRSF